MSVCSSICTGMLHVGNPRVHNELTCISRVCVWLVPEQDSASRTSSWRFHGSSAA